MYVHRCPYLWGEDNSRVGRISAHGYGYCEWQWSVYYHHPTIRYGFGDGNYVKYERGYIMDIGVKYSQEK